MADKTITYMVKSCLPRLHRPFNRKRTLLSTNGAWKTGCPHAKYCSHTLILQCIQKLTQNELKTKNLKAKIIKPLNEYFKKNLQSFIQTLNFAFISCL